MKNLVVLVLCISPLALTAQNFHVAARVGIANYQGDLQAKKFTFNQGKLFLSLGANYDLTEHITARSYLSFSSLQADDKKGNASMQQRNLSFATKLLDWELGAQYNILSLNNHWWTPYVFLGIGVFHYKPYTKQEDGTKTFLQPLSTEGQGFTAGVKEYKLTQLSLPFGIGGQYALNEDVRVGLELGFRKTFTDYLDDVSGEYVDEAALFSARGQTAVDLAYRGDEAGAGPYPAAKTQRGNAGDKDSYYYVALTVTMRLMDVYKKIAGLPAYRKDKKVGCPSTRF